MTRIQYRAWMLLLTCACLDRLTKWYVLLYRPKVSDITHTGIGAHFSLNTGAALSIGEGFIPQSYFIAVAGVALLLVIYHIRCTYTVDFSYMPLLYIVLGALSNMLDRYIYGGVIDFILCQYNSWCFPIFNGADLMITGGVLCFFVIPPPLKRKVSS